MLKYILIMFLLVGCGANDSDRYAFDPVNEQFQPPHNEDFNVPNEFLGYVLRFQEDAAKFKINISIDNLVVIFDELEANEKKIILGQCTLMLYDDGTLSEPPLIQIAESEWNRLEEESKETLMYHEMGHCILRRDHFDAEEKDDYLGADIPVSIMNAYLVPIEPYVLHHDRYLQELFTQHPTGIELVESSDDFIVNIKE